MAVISRTVAKVVLATGTSGFPVGIASLVKNSNFSSQAQISKKREEIKTIQESLNSASGKRNEIYQVVEKLRGEVFDASKGLINASVKLEKMIKMGFQSCSDREGKGLYEVKEKLKLGDKEEEITYCYPGCDKNLFPTLKEDTLSLYDETWKPYEKACFSAVIEHDQINKTIKGKIQLGLKIVIQGGYYFGETKGALLETDFLFSGNNRSNDKFENKFWLLGFSATDKNWSPFSSHKVTWTDSNQKKYWYWTWKNRFIDGYKKLDIWNSSNGLPQKEEYSAVKEQEVILDFFNYGSDLWRWNSLFNNSNPQGKFKTIKEKILDLNHMSKSKLGYWQELL